MSYQRRISRASHRIYVGFAAGGWGMSAAQKWSKPVFAQAKRLNKPSSVTSYQGCPLCKRTEDSSDLPKIQKLLENFEVVRINAFEQRDVDYSLMSFLRRFNGGGGGWPFHTVSNPQTFRPFLAASFLEEPQLAKFLSGGAEAWASVPEDCQKIGDSSTEAIDAIGQPVLGKPELESSFDIVEHAELQYGSMAHLTPRFIMASAVARFGPESRGKLLETISRSGMIDHLNGGVFSYSWSTDWHLPSFEKRLEDQATSLEAVAAQLAVEPKPEEKDELIRLAQGLVKCIRFFFAGKPRQEKYLWTYDEFHNTLKASGFHSLERDIAESYWGVNEIGNVNEELQKSSEPMLGDSYLQNVLSRYRTIDEVAENFGTEDSAVSGIVEGVALALAKSQGEQKSGVVTVACNPSDFAADRRGMVMTASAKVSPWVPEARESLDKAVAPFIEEFDVHSASATCSDFAFMIRGVLDYVAATGGNEHLVEKTKLWQQMQDKLFKSEDGSYYYGQAATEETSVDGVPMSYVRPRFFEDGTVPNYQSITLANVQGNNPIVKSTGLKRAEGSPLAYLTYSTATE